MHYSEVNFLRRMLIDKLSGHFSLPTVYYLNKYTKNIPFFTYLFFSIGQNSISLSLPNGDDPALRYINLPLPVFFKPCISFDGINIESPLHTSPFLTPDLLKPLPSIIKYDCSVSCECKCKC